MSTRHARDGNRPLRILAVASGGGHWVQLLRLRPAFAGELVSWVTVGRGARGEVGGAPFYTVNDATRWNRLGLLVLAARIAWIILRVRPDVIVTTGAAPGFFAVVIGKLRGARTVWIDSLANVERLSLCGRWIARFADLHLTQWPALAETPATGPRERRPRYEGSVL